MHETTEAIKIRRGRLRPPCKTHGGKYTFAGTNAELLSSTPHTTYCEPFCGGASVWLTVPRAKTEVINDLDSNVVAMWRANRMGLMRAHREKDRSTA